MKNLKIINLSHHFDKIVLANISIEIPGENIFSLVGPSGCGKTTLINLISGFIINNSDGQILINGEDIKSSVGYCGVVFQADAVFPWMTVEQNVGYGLRFSGKNPQEQEGQIKKYIDAVGLTGYENRWPRELSGGMRKRVDLARALAFNPVILLLDEPFGSLDVLTRNQMQTLLLDIWGREKKTILFVTHDPEEAIFVSQKVAVMTPSPGTIKQIFEVPFTYPRDHSLKLVPEFIDLRRTVIEALTT